MRKFILSSIAVLGFHSLFAQSYHVNLIPDSLKENADAVKRMEQLWVEIKSPSKAIIYHKYAITILNEDGFKHSFYTDDYDKLHSLSDISGHLYDAEGNVLKKVKKKDIQDVSYDDEMSLMTDTRIKRHSFFYKSYPYTIEYESQKECDGIYFLPNWSPFDSEQFSVQQSKFIVEFPADYELRYKQFQYDGLPVQNKQGKTQTLSWEINNRKSILRESFMPMFNEVSTTVFIAPSQFEVEGYKGNMSTWQGLGQFIASLNANRNALPDFVKADIRKIADGISSTEEKVKQLYHYLQKNTRYISIQMGIGSWQPFDAKYVATKKYGDCKALSNFMVSILQEAGIHAKYVLINSGEGRKGLWEDFPSPYFNHAIMCVPNGKDTIWLECTSQTRSAGFMGSSTGNRKALLIDEQGGAVVETPKYTSADNLQIRNVIAKIDTDGHLYANVNTRFTGTQQELQHSLIHNATEEERNKYLNNSIGLATFKVAKNEYKETGGKIPVIDEYLEITSEHYASVSGKRLFITPNLFNKMGAKLSAEKERKFDIVYHGSFKDMDTVLINVPEGYTTEAMPRNIAISSKFGQYKINFLFEGNQLKLYRFYERNAARYPASDYKELVKFYEDIFKADRSRIVLVKKEG